MHVLSTAAALLCHLCAHPSPVLSRSLVFRCGSGIDAVGPLPAPPLDLRLTLSARWSHHSRVSSMLSVVGRRRFPQFFARTAGRSPVSLADRRPAPEYCILCMYARALTEASTGSSIMSFPFNLGMYRNSSQIRESLNTHHPWEDLNVPACVDVVLHG